MEKKLKKERIRKIINRLEEIENSKDLDFILEDRIIKTLEVLLGVRFYSKKSCSEKEDEKEPVKKITGNGFKKKKRSCDNRF